MTISLSYTAGEIPEPLLVEFNNADDTDVDLTGTVQAAFTYRVNGGTPVEQPAVWDPVAGTVTYVWAAGDLATPGVLVGEMWVGNGTNRLASVKIAARIRAAAAVPSV